MPRRTVYLLFAVLLMVSLCFAQRPGGQSPSGSTGSGSRGNTGSIGGLGRPARTADLVIHVVFPNDHPAGENIAVELHAAAGGTVAQAFTNSLGEVTFRGIPGGSYTVTIRGTDVKDASSELISVDSYEGFNTEYIHVQPLNQDDTAVKSTQGSISAADLKIPEKARKEFDKGNEAAAKGDSKKASERYEKAIELYPKYAMAYNNLGVIYMKTNDKVHAQEVWNKALEMDPTLATANINIARLDVMDHDYPAAILLLERALAVQPTSGEVLLLMSEAQFLAGHVDEALLYSRKVDAIADHQKYEMARIIAGRALEAQNHTDLARIEYEVLLKEAPSAPEAEEARKSIARLDEVAKRR
jgi:tetratricopeptide (TPR) repeat protein